MSITRTTISIDSRLLSTAKRVAVERRRTLGQLISEALRSHLVETAAPARGAVVLPTAGQGGVRPGIDLNRNADLFGLLDQEEAARWSSPTSTS